MNLDQEQLDILRDAGAVRCGDCGVPFPSDFSGETPQWTVKTVSIPQDEESMGGDVALILCPDCKEFRPFGT